MALISGTAGDDHLIGTVDDDDFNAQQGGDDRLEGLEGNDAFIFFAEFTGRDRVDGGDGGDSIYLSGDYVLTLRSNTLTSVETISLDAGHDYDLTFVEDNFSGFATIRATFLDAGDTLIIDAHADTDADFFFFCGPGNEIIRGSNFRNTFYLDKGGIDAVEGGAGNDGFVFGAFLDAADTFDGKGGTDSCTLQGDYSAGLTITRQILKSIEEVTLYGEFDYIFTLDAGLLRPGETLSFSCNSFGGTARAEIDGSAIQNAQLAFSGNMGDDIFTGGSGDDEFTTSTLGGGRDNFSGRGGSDSFAMEDSLDRRDRINGGEGSDSLTLDGDYNLVFGAQTVKNIETLNLTVVQSYNLTTHDNTVAAGATLAVNAPAGGILNGMVFDGSAETDGSFVFSGSTIGDVVIAGAMNDTINGKFGDDVLEGRQGEDTISGGDGNDDLRGGAGADVLSGDEDADRIEGGFGADTYVLATVLESTSDFHDTWVGFNFNVDKIDIATSVQGIDAQITTGTLNAATFDADLQDVLNSGALGSSHAVLFTASAGDLAGHTFLIVDRNASSAGYHPSTDWVIEIEDGSNFNGLHPNDFI